MTNAPTREVHCQDALLYLRDREDFPGCSFVTSLPDVSELPEHDLDGWKRWFEGAAAQVLGRCPAEGVAIFFQTDIRKDTVWIDKGHLVQRAADEVGATLLWHKVVCRLPPGGATHGRPAYSHMLCFGRGVRPNLSYAYPDVLPDAGEKNWTRGMGAEACRLACRYILENTKTRTVVDPFCGKGMVLAVANALGLNAVGVELSQKRAKQARALAWAP